MKKLTLSLCAMAVLGSPAFAGTETYSKESKSVAPPPCPQWYADNEFNLSLSGVYAFSGDDSNLIDHGWGGAFDAKYFIHRYFGFGVQGFLLSTDNDDDNRAAIVRGDDDDDDDGAGGLLGTFTVRFPVNCSRFAPYVWVGGGGIWGGSDDNAFFTATGARVDNGNDDDAHWMGQVGGGFEIRFTPRCGLLNDFSWNIVSGSNNNFGMARTGINFAF